MISHYYTKQGEGAGMQRLSFPSNDAFFDERDQKKYLTSKELTAISNRIDEGETLPSIAREIGMYYCELRSQLKDNGYSYNNFKRCAKPPLEDMPAFVEWLGKNGVPLSPYPSKMKNVLYSFRMNGNTRYIKLVDGKVRLGSGFHHRYFEFCRERERESLPR